MRPLLETLGACLAGWLADLAMVTLAPTWTSLSQGPLIVAVLAISARHGLAWGTAACVLSAFLRAAELAWLQVAAGGSALPVLSPEVIAATFFLVVVAGTIGDTWQARRGLAALSAEDAWTLFDRMSGHFTSLLDQRHLLQQQVIDRPAAIPSLIALFGELDPSHPDAIPGTLVRIAHALAGSGEAALFAFRKRAQHGELIAGAAARWPATLDRDDPVIAAAFAKAGHVTLSQVSGVAQVAALPPGKAQVACQVPLEHPGTALVMVLTDLSLVSFAPARLEALERAMQVGGKALSRATSFARTRDLNVEDPVTGAVTAAYFEKRLAEHHALGRRHGHRTSLVGVTLPRPAVPLARSERRRAATKLARALQASLRDGDLLAVGRQPDVFWILCPFTPLAGAQVVAGRLSRQSPGVGLAVTEIDAQAMSLEATLEVVRRAPSQRS